MFANSSETVDLNELKFLRIISLGMQMVLDSTNCLPDNRKNANDTSDKAPHHLILLISNFPLSLNHNNSVVQWFWCDDASLKDSGSNPG